MNLYRDPLSKLFKHHSIDSNSSNSIGFYVSKRDLFTCFEIHYYLLELGLVEYLRIDYHELRKEVNDINAWFQLSLFKDSFKTDEPYIEFLTKKIDVEWPDSRKFTSKGLNVILDALRFFPKYQVLYVNDHIVRKVPYLLYEEDFKLDSKELEFLNRYQLVEWWYEL